jgi:AGZA family xanthine/uracil permease-like MFS transporter
MNVSFRRRSAFAVGILFVTFVSWFRGTAVTYFPNTEEGNTKFSFFSQVVAVQPVNLIVGQFTSKLNDVILALITMLYVDFLDTTGTLYGLAKSLDFIDKDGNFPRSRLAFAMDGVGAIVASIFGMSSVTAYIESAAGVEVGGRTGLTAVVTGFLFFLAIFFSPLLASIPPWATGGTLVIVRGSIPLYLFWFRAT